MSEPPSPPPSVPSGGPWAEPSGKRISPLIVAVSALVTAVVGAGLFFVITSGGDDERREEYIDALVSSSGTLDADFDLTEDEIRCMAEVQVDVVGVDHLAERYTPEELRDRFREDPDFELDLGDPTEEEAGQVVDGTNRCWDIFETMRSGAADVPSATPEMSACITEALDDSFLREAMVDDVMERADEDLNRPVALRVQDLCGHLE